MISPLSTVTPSMVYGDVPPIIVYVTSPLSSPLQRASVGVATISNRLGSPIVKLSLASHPFESITVTV